MKRNMQGMLVTLARQHIDGSCTVVQTIAVGGSLMDRLCNARTIARAWSRQPVGQPLPGAELWQGPDGTALIAFEHSYAISVDTSNGSWAADRRAAQQLQQISESDHRRHQAAQGDKAGDGS